MIRPGLPPHPPPLAPHQFKTRPGTLDGLGGGEGLKPWKNTQINEFLAHTILLYFLLTMKSEQLFGQRPWMLSSAEPIHPAIHPSIHPSSKPPRSRWRRMDAGAYLGSLGRVKVGSHSALVEFISRPRGKKQPFTLLKPSCTFIRRLKV